VTDADPETSIGADLPPRLRRYLEFYRTWDRGRMVGRQEIVRTPLYHYTDWAALRGILTNQAIWFTHYAHLNDPKELTHGIAAAQSIISRLRKIATSGPEDSFLGVF
jgi:hypothetical protein